ncbi:MAG: GNAT family N-acetyltransferase [Chloroflexi bacterium]|nr:GNAT family N-acetyltransferase [Chloroflexota bacterium]
MNASIERAGKEELAAIFALLARAGLPRDGLADHWMTTLVAREGQTVVGSAAVELYGDSALLRSVAVEEAWRGQGLGQRLTRAALDLARRHEVRIVFLLTETACAFFTRFGFRRIARSEVAPVVQRSAEFAEAGCPCAEVMRVELSPGA